VQASWTPGERREHGAAAAVLLIGLLGADYPDRPGRLIRHAGSPAMIVTICDHHFEA